MKTWFLVLCAVWLFASVPCPAQEPGGEAAPILFVYVAKDGENAGPRIALGLEKPALKISAFEKCVRMYDAKVDPGFAAIAVQLKPDDAKALIAAIKALGAPNAQELPDVVIFFTTPANKMLGGLNSASGNVEGNILKSGVIDFDPQAQSSVVSYLTAALHPQ